MNSISVRQLAKAYKSYPSPWARVKEWLDWRRRPQHELLWALESVSFDVAAGEAVGIIGVNGAGKSTLLKLITGTTRPTSGEITLVGNVAALLELGMGFHADFTGRQNAIMAGQLLGYSAEQMQLAMPAIEAFAEIGSYIDKPVRVYSSGMIVRLAFSVATAHRPDILIVDEALSVGDSYFQHKCMARIREFREHGTTLLLVSHDKLAIQQLCDRAILLSAGRVLQSGPPEAVMDYYNAMLAEHQASTIRTEQMANGKVQTVSGSGEAQIQSVELRSAAGEVVEVVSVGQVVTLRLRVAVNETIPALTLGYVIKDRLGQPVYGTNTHYLGLSARIAQAGSEISYDLTFAAALGEGRYSIAVALHSDENHLQKNFEWRDLAVVFDVINTQHSPFVGVAWLPPTIRVTCHEQ